MSASDQIAAGAATKKRADPAKLPKACGAPGCVEEVAAGAKLRLTVLELPTAYPAAVKGRLSVCKSHRKCVGFAGYSPDQTEGTPAKPSCGSPAKLIFLGQAFCEACHNTFTETLLAQLKPRLTPEVILVARRQVVKDNYKEPGPADPLDSKMAELATQMAALKAEKTKTKGKPAALAAASASAPAAPVPGSESATLAAPPKVRGKKAVAAAAAAAPPPPPRAPTPVSGGEDDEEDAESVSDDAEETPRMRVAQPPTPMKPVPKLDEFAELELKTKTEKAQAVVAQAKPAVVAATAPKGKKGTAPVVKA